ncbi:MAG: DUF2490 domain-containing protein [Opitutales bacterium]|nr:DUF2490 domain-containing protein [Opitutales bacterium]
MKLLNTLKVAAIALVGMAAYQAHAYEDGDTQLWLKASAKLKVASSTTFVLEEEFKYGDDMSELYDKETLIMLDHKINDYFSIAYGYRHVVELSGNTWKDEDRPTLDFKFKQSASGWSFEERIRWEYRMKQDSDEYSRYRVSVKAKSPWKFTSLALNPYVSVESNYSDKDSNAGWDRHRFYVGMGMKFNDHISGDLYFCRQRDDKGSSWRDYNAIGMAVGFKY